VPTQSSAKSAASRVARVSASAFEVFAAYETRFAFGGRDEMRLAVAVLAGSEPVTTVRTEKDAKYS
jgi:hypothetical protein